MTNICECEHEAANHIQRRGSSCTRCSCRKFRAKKEELTRRGASDGPLFPDEEREDPCRQHISLTLKNMDGGKEDQAFSRCVLDAGHRTNHSYADLEIPGGAVVRGRGGLIPFYLIGIEEVKARTNKPGTFATQAWW